MFVLANVLKCSLNVVIKMNRGHCERQNWIIIIIIIAALVWLTEVKLKLQSHCNSHRLIVSSFKPHEAIGRANNQSPHNIGTGFIPLEIDGSKKRIFDGSDPMWNIPWNFHGVSTAFSYLLALTTENVVFHGNYVGVFHTESHGISMENFIDSMEFHVV